MSKKTIPAQSIRAPIIATSLRHAFFCNKIRSSLSPTRISPLIPFNLDNYNTLQIWRFLVSKHLALPEISKDRNGLYLVIRSFYDGDIYTKEPILPPIISAIPSHITYLRLGGDAFDVYRGAHSEKITSKKLAEIIAAIPPHVKCLDLSQNCLNFMKPSELATALNNIPPTVTSLILSRNDFSSKGDKLDEIIKAIPATVQHIDLSGNCLFKMGMNINDLARAMASFKPTLVSLDLSDNDNDKTHPPFKLTYCLCLIPDTITSLDLTGNKLEDLELVEIGKHFLSCDIRKKTPYVFRPLIY